MVNSCGKNGILNSKCVLVGYKRSIRNQNMNKVLVKINCEKRLSNQNYFLGKKLKISDEKSKKKNLGKIIGLHGRSSTFIAKFKKPLSPNFINKFLTIEN
mmetsp:Transcript_17759/g.40199  ORF Transcript_17759/g.40199 Transcript_17759/m.40199 type:complete len:100 (-) Transcript_17759:1104-1403(-)